MQIEVTAEDIFNGQPFNPVTCPIALALRRVFPDSEIDVGYHDFEIDDKAYITNWEIFHFLLDFDFESKKVKPFSFDLDNLWSFSDAEGYIPPKEIRVEKYKPKNKWVKYRTW